ncbi:hypothetical protein BDQ12DRAFT_685818 [Crucibulum laeve]|uniref:Integral membrane protein n=1 Tax=Crucibulum laeve TaxID=68775 RepID=A0A5C3LVI0_9AGAR|nr:hypothetical protein BDQ12DRAFT_685818 [Crucibulum laeve]
MQVQALSERDVPGLGPDIVQVLGIFLSAVNAAVLAEALLYGIHIVLFTICIYILIKNRKSTHPAILVAVVIMFALSTADIAITFRAMIEDLPKIITLQLDQLDNILRRIYPKNPIFVANNLVADILLLHRCCMVWKHQKYVIIFASVLLFADSVWGWVGVGTRVVKLQEVFAPVYLWSVFGINISMTLVTAGRIYWVARKGRSIIGQRSMRIYNTAIAILIETGALYSCCILIYLLFPKNSPWKIVSVTVVMRTVSIMPTLMIVQAALTRRTSAYTTQRTSVNPGDGPGHPTSIVLDTINTACIANIEDNSHELDEDGGNLEEGHLEHKPRQLVTLDLG